MLLDREFTDWSHLCLQEDEASFNHLWMAALDAQVRYELFQIVLKIILQA